MTGKVIERLETSVDDAGLIQHNERPATFAAADALAGHRVDRRKTYAIVEGKLCESAKWTAACSGCTGEYGPDRGSGCHECGFTGRSRQAMWVPYGISASTE